MGVIVARFLPLIITLLSPRPDIIDGNKLKPQRVKTDANAVGKVATTLHLIRHLGTHLRDSSASAGVEGFCSCMGGRVYFDWSSTRHFDAATSQ